MGSRDPTHIAQSQQYPLICIGGVSDRRGTERTYIEIFQVT